MYKILFIFFIIIILYLIYKYNIKYEYESDYVSNQNELDIHDDTEILVTKKNNNNYNYSKHFNKYDNYSYFRGLLPSSFNLHDNHEIGGSKYFMSTILLNDHTTQNNINYNKYESYRIKPTLLKNIKNIKKKNYKCNNTENANLYYIK